MSENKNNKPEKEVTKIEVKEPLTFESMLDGKLITQADLAASINSLLSGVFADYEGCHLTPNVQFPNVLDIALYFKDKGPVTDGRLKSVISTKIPEANTPFARIKSMNLRNQEKNFDLNEDTKQALSELMYPSNGQFDKETGLPLRIINRGGVEEHFPGTDVVKEVRDNIQEYEYSFGTVTDEDVKVPDLNSIGYEIENKEYNLETIEQNNN